MPIETKVRPYECGAGFSVTAHLDGKTKGLCTVHFEDGCSLGCFITSLQPSSGIPCALISKASEEISFMAKKLGKKLTHRVVLVNERSQLVLTHIYEEFGYKNKGMSELNLIMTKEYNP